MSIYAYTGLPGSGKSYSVVENQVLPALKSGRRLVTNVALHFDKLREAFPACDLVEFPTDRVKGSPETIYEYVTPGSVLILDEVWKIFPAGLKANHVPEPWKKLLAEHRHMVNEKGDSCQIVLVTQDLAQISAFARQLVETTFRTVKLTTVGLQQQFRVDVYNGPVTGPNPPDNARIRQIFGTYQNSVYQYYSTHTLKHDASTGKVNEKSIDRRANILLRPSIMFGMVVAVGLIGYFGVRIANRFGGEPVAAAAVAAPATASQPPARLPTRTKVTTAPVREPVAEPIQKATAQLVGIIENIDNADASMALVRLDGRVVSRPLRYCSNMSGWWQCEFPDLGGASL